VELVGTVATAAGNEQRRFHTIEELWDFLAAEVDAQKINSSDHEPVNSWSRLTASDHF